MLGRNFMDIKTIPLSRLETNLQATLVECADSGQAVVVTLPDQRLIAIQSLDATEDDSLVDDLLESNPEFQSLVAKSKASPRKPFPPAR
jgi:predicted neuraminidase